MSATRAFQWMQITFLLCWQMEGQMSVTEFAPIISRDSKRTTKLRYLCEVLPAFICQRTLRNRSFSLDRVSFNKGRNIRRLNMAILLQASFKPIRTLSNHQKKIKPNLHIDGIWFRQQAPERLLSEVSGKSSTKSNHKTPHSKCQKFGYSSGVVPKASTCTAKRSERCRRRAYSIKCFWRCRGKSTFRK